MAAVMLLGVGCTFGTAACGDTTEDACSVAQDAVPSVMRGVMRLEIEELGGEVMELDLKVTTSKVEDDHCAIHVEMSQDSNPLCGSDFIGELHYLVEEGRWDGDVKEVEDGKIVSKGTRMLVQLTPLGNASMDSYNVMEDGMVLCKGREIRGTLNAVD